MPDYDHPNGHQGSTAMFVLFLLLCLLLGGGYYYTLNVKHQERQRQKARLAADKARMLAEQSATAAKQAAQLSSAPDDEAESDTDRDNGSELPASLPAEETLRDGEETNEEALTPAPNELMDNGRTDRKEPMIWAFDWPDVENATKYHLYVRGANATIPVINHSNLVESGYLKIDRSFIAERHRKGWTWKVRAFSKGKWGDWSELRTFDVEPVNTDAPLDD